MVDSEPRGWAGVTDLPVKRWVLVTGSRTVFTAILTGGVALLTIALVFSGVVYVGAGSTLATVLASGMIGALATIVTVTLSINQLILSRVFGSPAELTEQLEGNLEFRRSIEDVAGVNTSPNDPGSFLSLIARTLEERAGKLERQTADLDDPTRDTVREFTSSLVDYADYLDSGEGADSTFEVLARTFGTEYADYIDDARHVDRAAAGELPDEAAAHLDAILELLKGIATIRQFFKTLAIQQDLARLSRQLIYTGVPALLVAYFLAQVYVGSELAPAVPSGVLPWVAALATPVLFAPLFLIVSYILRVATVTLYTVSVGSFIPPEERVD